LAGKQDKKHMANLMTETDALAAALAPVLDGATSFTADSAEKACNTATDLLTEGKIDKATFGRVISRIGNHSAVRQWAVKMGLIPASDSKPDALCLAIQAIHAKSDKALEEIAKSAKK
jgi:hypothetical protein